jgi:hypothetical protein
VPGAAFVIKEMAGRLDHDVGLNLAPLQRLGVALGAKADAPAVDQQVVAVDGHGAGEIAVHRVVLEHVGEVVGFEQVVDGDHLEVCKLLFTGDGAEGHAPDAAEAVDGYPDGHDAVSCGL